MDQIAAMILSISSQEQMSVGKSYRLRTEDIQMGCGISCVGVSRLSRSETFSHEHGKNHSCCFTTFPDKMLNWRPQVTREFEQKVKHRVKNHKDLGKTNTMKKMINSANVKYISEETVDRAIVLKLYTILNVLRGIKNKNGSIKKNHLEISEIKIEVFEIKMFKK